MSLSQANNVIPQIMDALLFVKLSLKTTGTVKVSRMKNLTVTNVEMELKDHKQLDLKSVMMVISTLVMVVMLIV